MARLRIDWPKIRDTLDSEAYVYVLDRRAASVILGAFHQLEWQSTFRLETYDFADWDDLQSILAEAEQSLGTGMSLAQLITYIDEIEDMLRAIRDTAGCCGDAYDETGGQFSTDPVTDGVGDVPQNIIDAGYATDAADWSGFDDYKCMIAHVAVDSMAGKLRALAPYIDNAGAIVGGIAAITGIITTIVTGSASFLVLGLLGSVATAANLIDKFTSGSFAETLADQLDTNHDDLACAIYQSDGSEDAVVQLNAKIDELFSGVEALIYKNLNTEPVIRALYAGRYDQQNVAQVLADNGYDVEDFDCTCMEFQFDFLAEWNDNMHSFDVGGRAQYGGDASCPSTNHIKHNPCTSDDSAATSILQDAATKAGYPWPPTTPRIGFVHQVEFTYEVGTTFASQGKSGQIRILYEDGSSDSVAIDTSPGLHTTVLRGSDVKEVQADGPTNQSCIRIEGNQVGVCNDVNAQFCVKSAKAWCSVSAA